MPGAISRRAGMPRGLPRPAPGKTPLAPAGVEPANRWPPPYPVKGSRAGLKSHGFWAIPEQALAPPLPGQPPLSRWIAQIDNVFTPLERANASTLFASATVVTSVFFG